MQPIVVNILVVPCTRYSGRRTESEYSIRFRLRNDLAQDLIGITVQFSGFFSGPSITGPNGFEISLAFILTHVTALRFGLPEI